MTDNDGYARIAAQFSLLQGEVISERARAEKAEAALHALEAQVHAEETPHRTRMRVAEARVKVLEAALDSVSAELGSGTPPHTVMRIIRRELEGGTS